jgi:hypothetical protein
LFLFRCNCFARTVRQIFTLLSSCMSRR